MHKKRYLLIFCITASLSQATVPAAIEEIATFIKKFAQEGGQMGSICPSSQALAQELTKFVGHETAPQRTALQLTAPQFTAPQFILEVGAGTGGHVTEAIIAKLKPEDHFDIVEIDSEFCQELMHKYGHIPQVSIHCTSITSWQPTYKYNTIIGTVPLHVLPIELMKDILHSYKELAENGGMVSFIQYWGQPLLHAALSKSIRDQLSEKIAFTKAFREQYFHESTFVLLNVPPTYAHHLKIKK